MDAVVYHPVKLADFIQYLLYCHDTPILLVVCMSAKEFATQLQSSIDAYVNEDAAQAHLQPSESRGDTDAVAPPSDPAQRGAHPLVEQTLRMLSRSMSIQVAFCPSVQVLHAYLSTLSSKQDIESKGVSGSKNARRSILALLNPISLHSRTGSYSAQGLSKLLAAAIEAALRCRRRLVVIETTDQPRIEQAQDENEDSAMDVDDGMPNRVGASRNIEQEDNGEDTAPGLVKASLWEEKIPILNATTKTYGVGSDRGWLGRTVRLCDVFEKYCHFQELPAV